MSWMLTIVTKDGHVFSQLEANPLSRKEIIHNIESLYGMGHALDLGECHGILGDVIIPSDNISHITIKEV